MRLSPGILIAVAVAISVVAGIRGLTGAPLPVAATNVDHATTPHLVASPLRPETSQDLPLAPGHFRVNERDGRFTVAANLARRSDVLEAVADHGDIWLVDHLDVDPLISITLRDERIEQTLIGLMQDTPFVIRYAAAPQRRTLSIDTIEIGVRQDVDRYADASELRPIAGGHEARRSSEKKADIKKHNPAARIAPARRSEAARRFALERRQAREVDRHVRALDELNDEDPETRAWAASSLDIDDPQDLRPLARLLKNDPNPMVRVEIAYDLGFGQPRTVVPLLVSALDDPSNKVVVAAAESLGFLDDVSVVRDLESLLANRSEDIRNAAKDALALLEGAQ